MAANARRNSTNINNLPTITIVESVVEPAKRRSCCGCVPEATGVFAILSIYFFLGVFYAAASFVSLSTYNDVTDIVITCISGSLHAILAIASAFGVNAIKKEKVVMMRHLSIVFWVFTGLLLVLDIVILVLEFVTKATTIQICQEAVRERYGEGYVVDCTNYVNDTLISDSVRTFIMGTTSVYFAYVIFRYARRMKEFTLPFTVPADGQKTPTYLPYGAHPPTSNNWVPPPTYSVTTTGPLPDDFNPDSKQAPVYETL